MPYQLQRRDSLGVFKSLFKSSRRAMAFVDYEYWFYSYKTRFGIRPEPSMWRTELAKKYILEDIMVFADFSSPGLNEELGKLREITNTIIETGNESQRRKKDMTDFVMLDYIYQFVDNNKDIDTYIIFTGDGNFQSVIKYLVQKKHKKVVLYGVQDSTSKRLQAVASETVMIPYEDELYKNYGRMITENMDYVLDKPRIIPTFNGTVEAVSERNGVPKDTVKSVLSRMVDEGYIVKRDMRIEYNKTIKTIAADWSKLIKDGLWQPGK